MLIYRKPPIGNTVARYIRKERAIFPYIYKENTIIQTVLYIKALFSLYTEILWAGGKLKKKKWFIYKINTPMYIGKIHIQRIYLDKIYKKKVSFLYIYIVKHIFFWGKMSNFHIYIYKKNIHYNLGKIQKKKEMYRQKSVIFTIGKTLYIENTHFWGKIQKKKEGFFYI